MSRYIDADALKEGIKELKQSPWYNNDINPSWRQGIKDAVHVVETLCIDEEPTVDAVPVIRCKDCIWNREKEWVDCYMSGMHGRNVNNFCSQGKRREE